MGYTDYITEAEDWLKDLKGPDLPVEDEKNLPRDSGVGGGGGGGGSTPFSMAALERKLSLQRAALDRQFRPLEALSRPLPWQSTVNSWFRDPRTAHEQAGDFLANIFSGGGGRGTGAGPMPFGDTRGMNVAHMKNLAERGQWVSEMGVAPMTPGEASGAGWFGPSTPRWTGDPAEAELMGRGITPLSGADIARDVTEQYILTFGYPSFMTPYVSEALDYTPEEMADLGYVEDPESGYWVLTEREDTEEASSGDYYYRKRRYGGGGGGFAFGGGDARMGRMGGRMYSWRIGV